MCFCRVKNSMFEEQTFNLLKWFEQHETENGLFISNAHHPI